MKKTFIFFLTLLSVYQSVLSQPTTVTVDANEVLNSNNKLIIRSGYGQSFYTGHQAGGGYANPTGIFRAMTDNANGAMNYYYDGVTAGISKFNIRADGQAYFASNVGIGTTNPTATLSVFKSTPLGSTIKSSSLLSSISGSAAGGNNFQNNTWLVRNSAGTTWETTRLHDGISIDGEFLSPQINTLTWWERNPSTDIQSWGNQATTYMTIDKGNVSIGTPNARGYKLAVNGKIRALEIKVESADWPDYVFHKDYSLPPLNEVRAYIDKNRHLAGIPSAKEVADNGINLGEINKALTQKIEELTLYILEQDKKSKEQESRLYKLEQEMSRLLKSKL
jgi:hypothetical protein